MKLRNKLIPLLTIAATASTVAPIAASCGTRSVLSDDTLDITSPFTPTIARAEKHEEATDPAKALDIYMNNVMANPDILRQDIWYYEAKKLPSRISNIEHTYISIDGKLVEDEEEKYNSVTNVTATVNISNVEVNRHEAIIKAQKTEFYTISMNIGYVFQFTATSLSTEPRIQLTKTVNFQSTYTNIPLYMYKADNMWFVSINLFDKTIDPYLQQLPTWSLACDLSSNYDLTISTQGLTQTFSDSRSNNDVITRRSQAIAIAQREQQESGSVTLLGAVADLYMHFASYHMANVARPADMVRFVPTTDTIYATMPEGERYVWTFQDGQTAGILESNDEAKARTKKASNIYIKTYDIETGNWFDGFKYLDTPDGGKINNPTIYCTKDAYQIDLGNTNSLKKTSDNELVFDSFFVWADDCYMQNKLEFVIPAGTIYKIVWEINGEDVEEQMTISSDFNFTVTLSNP